MKIIKYPLALLVAGWITALVAAPVTSGFNLLWLMEMDMPVNSLLMAEVLVRDLYRFGAMLSGLAIATYFIAFGFAGILHGQFKLPATPLYVLAGAVGFPLAIFIAVQASFQVQLVAGFRTEVGMGLHALAGAFGGLAFGLLTTRERNLSFLIRTLTFIPFLFISWTAFDWAVTPAEAAAGFGFDFGSMNEAGINTTIRDMTAFFMGNATFMLLAIITLSSHWLVASALIFLFAMIFNYLAVQLHGTNTNPAIYFELVLCVWLASLALVARYHAKAVNRAAEAEEDMEEAA